MTRVKHWLINGAGIFVALNLQAGVLITAEKIEQNVVVRFSGSLDLTGAVEVGRSNVLGAGISPVEGALSSAPGIARAYEIAAFDPDISFGAGGETHADAVSGDTFFLFGDAGLFGVPEHYVSGQTLAGSLMFENATLDDLGIGSEKVLYALPGD